MILARGLVVERAGVLDTNGILRVEPRDAMILHENTRHAISRSGDDERLVETDLERTRFDIAVPIEIPIAETDVPLADNAGPVAAITEHRGQRKFAWLDERRRVARQNTRSLLAKGILSREQR